MSHSDDAERMIEEANEDIEYEEEEVEPEVAAADLLDLWSRTCSPISLTASEGASSSQNSVHVSVDDDNDDLLCVTYGTGDLGKDTYIFSLNGKLKFVAVDEKDIPITRSNIKETKNDQYNVTIEIQRAAGDVLESRLNSIYRQASSGESGTFLTTRLGQEVTPESFCHSWRRDCRLYIRNFVARPPQQNFSPKRKFSVPGSPNNLIKPTNFVFGPAPLFYDEEGHYVSASKVRSQMLGKEVRVMFTVKLSPSQVVGKVFSNLEILSVQALNSEVSLSPAKKRRLSLGI